MIERLELYDDGGAVATAAIKFDLNDLHPKIIESSADYSKINIMLRRF
jgi:hypothetical protein